MTAFRFPPRHYFSDACYCLLRLNWHSFWLVPPLRRSDGSCYNFTGKPLECRQVVGWHRCAGAANRRWYGDFSWGISANQGAVDELRAASTQRDSMEADLAQKVGVNSSMHGSRPCWWRGSLHWERQPRLSMGARPAQCCPGLIICSSALQPRL